MTLTHAGTVPLSMAEGFLPPAPAIGVVGVGSAGTALALALARAGHSLTAAYSRGPESARRLAELHAPFAFASSAQEVVDRCDVVFLTVPDTVIEAVAGSLRWRPGQVAVHCSGALGTSVLRSVEQQGAVAVALHPLCSLPRAVAAAIPVGTRFAYTGPDNGRSFFAALVESLGGVLLELPEQARTLYHAAAVLSCNFTVTLTALAVSLLQANGMEGGAALAALLPLLRGTIDNLEHAGLPAALTGPVVRGDLATVAAHSRALQELGWGDLYDALAQATAVLALERADLSDETRAALSELKTGGMA